MEIREEKRRVKQDTAAKRTAESGEWRSRCEAGPV
jgi:hypothetical protein